MTTPRFEIDPNIREAHTPPSDFYRTQPWYDRTVDRIFARSWLPIADHAAHEQASWATPQTLLPGSLDEPVALVTDGEGVLRCLSNVCTHRGNLVVLEPGPLTSLRCGYHGRRFDVDGRFRSMPCFEEVTDFPTERDHLRSFPLERFGPLYFTTLDAPCPFDEILGPVRDRLHGLPLGELALDPESVRSYEVAAHWALYVDNYLEGFHIPFVHEGLADSVELSTYRTELERFGVLQVGFAHEDEPAFERPSDHVDGGRRVAAYWWWLFPNTMLNFYPWGLSLNRVEPDGPERTRIHYREYVWNATLRRKGAGGDLDRVEREDDQIVEQVARGLRSRIYDRGRYSPTQEQGVHHFHRLLAEFLSERG